MLLSLLAVVFISNTLSMQGIIRGAGGLSGNILIQPLAFIIYFVAAVAETNRAPFRSSRGGERTYRRFSTPSTQVWVFSLFVLGEYTNMFFVCSIATVVFFGRMVPDLLSPSTPIRGSSGSF